MVIVVIKNLKKGDFMNEIDKLNIERTEIISFKLLC